MPTIKGINHLVLMCSDMERTVHFYQDLLGLKVVATFGEDRMLDPMEMASSAVMEKTARARAKLSEDQKYQIGRLYFFEFPNGDYIGFFEVRRRSFRHDQTISLSNWPGETNPPSRVPKVDHLALSVDTREDLARFQQHLRAHGVQTSEIEERASNPKFVKSIYFYDPDGFPLEIATWDWDDPAWTTVNRKKDWMMDGDAVPSLPRG